MGIFVVISVLSQYRVLYVCVFVSPAWGMHGAKEVVGMHFRMHRRVE